EICQDNLIVQVDRDSPFGNGPWTSGTLTVADLNKTVQARVSDISTGNKCWLNLTVKDSFPPVFNCQDITIPCLIDNDLPAYLRDSLGIAAGVPGVSDGCGAINTPVYVDNLRLIDCDSGVTKVITRVWQASDMAGNTSSCVQHIYFQSVALSEANFPADSVLLCTAAATPAATGYPYFEAFGRVFPVTQSICDVAVNFENTYGPPLCGGLPQILRQWRLVDFCTQEERLHVQVINVQDTLAPGITCPAAQVYTVDATGCAADIDLPSAVLTDGCTDVAGFQAFWTSNDVTRVLTGTLSDFPQNDPLNPHDTLGVMGVAPDFPLGTTTVLYIATDACGQTSECSFDVTVTDSIPPVAKCDSIINVSLALNPSYMLPALELNDGSADTCLTVYFKARWLNPSLCSPNNVLNDSLMVCCQNAGDTIIARLRVYNIPTPAGSVPDDFGLGHYTDCLTRVAVNDSLILGCTPPPDVIVGCSIFDPMLSGYGQLVSQSCNTVSVAVIPDYTQFDTACSSGIVRRVFRVTDGAGNTASCVQTITVNHDQDYYIRFPDDQIVTSCSATPNYGVPTFFGMDCENMDVSYQDLYFPMDPNSCTRIDRTWLIKNLCQYDPMQAVVLVPNPNPSNLVNSPDNLPGPIVSAPTAAGPWASTVVKIVPTDPAATNYSTFWQKNANGYQYTQRIRIIDTQDPIVTNCPTGPVTFQDSTTNDVDLWNEAYWWDAQTSSHNLCEGAADLNITTTDLCTGNNVDISYRLYLDLDRDGTQETIVSSDQLPGFNQVYFGNNDGDADLTDGAVRAFDERMVQPNQKWGFALRQDVVGNNVTASVRWWSSAQSLTPGAKPTEIPKLPYGNHQIRWYVTDGCGNDVVCSYNFTVRDGLPPIIHCLPGLTVNVLPSLMITLWASDFLQYTEDNCSPNPLPLGIRKQGTGSGFPMDGNGNPQTSISYTCDEFGMQQVELWTIDLAGNADSCQTFVIVQDNLFHCTEPPEPLSGFVKTEMNEGISNVSVTYSIDPNPSLPTNSSMVLTNGLGLYQMPLTIFGGQNPKLKAEYDQFPLNGLSTFDLVLISKHILNIEPLTSPYKMIAADANKSGNITTFDIVEFRKLLLGIYSELPQVPSWRFVPKSFVFPNPNNPFQAPGFPEEILLPSPFQTSMDYDFVGIKVGDVNNSAMPNAQAAAETRGDAQPFFFETRNEMLTAGQTGEAIIRAGNHLEATQFTLETDDLEILGIEPVQDVEADQIAQFKEKNCITVAIETGGSPAFKLNYRARTDGQLAEKLRFSSRITPAAVYEDLSGTAMRPVLKYDNPGIALSLLSCQPNPFTDQTEVLFSLPSAGSITISVTDAQGRVVWQQTQQRTSGIQSEIIYRDQLGNDGIYHVHIQSEKERVTRKLALIR
ncbi:MAG: T9SS type A sorting domain-containing protein, partial [Saprospiraceae bacterium]|nr:T9SS type A sorting domain-containing protein [Saprospiraceae bacterium]